MESQNYLKLWGFQQKDYELNYKELKLSSAIIKHLEDYIANFPVSSGIVFQGNPKMATKAMAHTIKRIYDSGSFKNRVSIVDVPTYFTKVNTLQYEERSTVEARMAENVVNSDIVVFQEIGLTQWSPIQQTKLYTLLYERYSKELPIFCTVSCSAEALEDFIGKSNFFRLADACTFLDLNG